VLRVDKVFRTERALRAAINHFQEIFRERSLKYTFNPQRRTIQTDKELVSFYTAANLDQAYQRAGQEVDRVDILESLPTDVCCYLNARIKPRASV